MDRKKNTIEDFLADPEFKKWVLNPDRRSQIFWDQWIEVHPHQRDNIRAARELILLFKFNEAEIVSEEDKSTILKNIIENDEVKSSNHKFRWRSFLGIAASLAIAIISLHYFLNLETNDIQPTAISQSISKKNPLGQKTKFSLPDGSTVWLNSGSELSYSSEFSDSIRILVLKGEAFFQVAKDANRPFTVISKGITTTALGTAFNIQAYDQTGVKINLAHGSISVSNGNTIILDHPGRGVVFNPESHDFLQTFDKDQTFASWKDGVIVFSRSEFNEIKERLERWYNVEITAVNLDRNLSFSGEFDNESLERVLERMAFVENFTFEMNDKQVKIYF